MRRRGQAGQTEQAGQTGQTGHAKQGCPGGRREPAGWAAAGATALLLSQRYLGSGILSLLFIRFYRGERGRIQYKYAWYGLYPLHLLILYGLSLFMR